MTSVPNKISSELQKATALYTELSREWRCGAVQSRNLERCGQLLKELKLSLANFSLLPTHEQKSDTASLELVLARDTLEIGAEWSIAVRDTAAFERYMQQLKTYYMDVGGAIPPSAYMLQLLGLELMWLLASNRLSEFHAAVERIERQLLRSPAALEADPYLAHAVRLERYLVEGNYNKILQLAHQTPADSYRLFGELFLCTVREEMASCIEASYEQLRYADAAQLLDFHIDPAERATDWVQQERDFQAFYSGRKWRLNSSTRCFEFVAAREGKSGSGAPAAGQGLQTHAAQLADYCLSTAIELELII